jgi:6-phosphogluconolactonase
MLRSIGSVTFLALLMVGCGGGGGDSGSSSGGGDSGSPPPPPPVIGYTVSGLVGSGLSIGICPPFSDRSPPIPCNSVLQIGANGAFSYPAGYPASGDIIIIQQPSSPTQNCIISRAAISIQNPDGTGITLNCAEYSYVTNAADNTLSSYSVDATTGALSVIGTPTATGASPHAIVGTIEYYALEEKRYVYVGNEGSNDVSAFAVNPTTGALTEVPGSPFPAGTDPQGMALYGPNLFVANAGSDNVSAYTIDLSTGALTAQPGSPVAVGKSPTSIVVDSENGIVFVANHGGSNDISAFYFYNLTPVPGSPFPAGGNPLSLALTFWQGGMFLYTANPDATNPSISGFSVSGFSDDPTSGAFSPLSGSPFPLPVSHYIATAPVGVYISTGPMGSLLGPYLYVISGASIVGYASDIATGALTALPGFPVATGANAYSITIDPTNQFLYVANDGAANISGFRLDASTGALTPMSGSPFPAGHHPAFIATF